MAGFAFTLAIVIVSCIFVKACEYKGKIYEQGEVWTDGCDYNCTCVNKTVGSYQCREICPPSIYVPFGCTSVIPPGKCCLSLSCPGDTVTVGMTTSQTVEPCMDKLSTCNLLDQSFYCIGEYFNWAVENCRNFCGYCGVLSTNTHNTAPPKTCAYRGKYYDEGDSWTDCPFHCTCVDGSTGNFSCEDVCNLTRPRSPVCAGSTDCCTKIGCGATNFVGK